MAVYEKDGLMTYKDGAGNTFLLYPITRADNVDGFEDKVMEQAPSIASLVLNTAVPVAEEASF